MEIKTENLGTDYPENDTDYIDCSAVGQYVTVKHETRSSRITRKTEQMQAIKNRTKRECSEKNDLQDIIERDGNKKKAKKGRKSKVALEEFAVVDEDQKKCFQCPVCNRIIRSRTTFLAHRSIHTGERPYFCDICGKDFRLSSHLARHINDFHLKIKRHACKLCDSKFSSTSFLKAHMNIHTNTRPFVCEICGKAFKQSGSLQIHKLYHGNNFRYTCDICGKKYRRATELKIHNRVHTGERPYMCSSCPAAFLDSKTLKVHIKIHEKTDIIYSCNLCGNKFSQERYLKNHLRNHRKKSQELAAVEVNSSRSDHIPTND